MSDTQLTNTTDPAVTPATKKSKKKNWIVASLGLVLVILGSLSVFQTEDINILAIEIGSKTVTQEMVEAYPEHEAIWSTAAEVLESGIKARTTSPDALATLISNELNDAMGYETPEIKEISEKIIEQINSLWKSSPNEEIYIEKLEALVSGIKKAL